MESKELKIETAVKLTIQELEATVTCSLLTVQGNHYRASDVLELQLPGDDDLPWLKQNASDAVMHAAASATLTPEEKAVCAAFVAGAEPKSTAYGDKF